MNRAVPALALIGALALGASAQAQETDEWTSKKAGEIFERTCVNCHQRPDNTFAVDRAWLDQIFRTA